MYKRSAVRRFVNNRLPALTAHLGSTTRITAHRSAGLERPAQRDRICCRAAADSTEGPVVKALQALTQKVSQLQPTLATTPSQNQSQDNNQQQQQTYRGRGRGRGRSRGRGRGGPGANGQIICFGCHRPGHILNNCPSRNMQNANASAMGYLNMANPAPPPALLKVILIPSSKRVL